MLKTQVLKHYGSYKAVYESLGITSGAVSQWGEVIPEKQALRLAQLTDGALVYRPALYRASASEVA